MGEEGELEDSVFEAYMRHSIAVLLHLVFVVSLILPFYWNRCKCYAHKLESSVSKPAYSKKLQYGVTHKMALLSCVSLSVLYSLLGIWSPFYWWLKERPKDVGAEGEYIVQGMAWAIISAYVYYSLTKKGREKLPILLWIWWILSLILYAFFFYLNIEDFKKQKCISLNIVVEALDLFLSAFLCYADCRGRTSNRSLTESIEEPLLSDIPKTS